MRFLFVGEKRSNLAIKMKVTWKDGNLAAKQLFDALNHCGIDPKQQEFVNLFERGGKKRVREYKGRIVAMGNKVSNGLLKMRIPHIKIVHPAARGKIRTKSLYCNHVKDNLLNS